MTEAWHPVFGARLVKAMALDNRELASLILIGVAACAALAWLVRREESRRQLASVVRAFFQPAIVGVITAALAYVALEVWIASQLSLWDGRLAKPTLIWLFTAAGMIFGLHEASSQPRYFRKVLAAAARLSVFMEFFINVYVFSLPGEIILQLVVTFLFLLKLVAEKREDARAVKTLVESCLGVIGIAIGSYTLYGFYRDRAELDLGLLSLEIALPIWLTWAFVPFVLALSLRDGYSLAFTWINRATPSKKCRWRSKVVLLGMLRLNVRAVHEFRLQWTKRLVDAQSFGGARAVIRAFLDERRKTGEMAAQRRENLKRYAGSKGVDDKGRPLDRREFEETKRALRWLETCQIGWYRNHGERYRADLLELIGGFEVQGVGEPAGIVLTVARDGQSWFAWRRTISGWCFAIGAAGPPPDRWTYDGAEPPKSYPGRDERWGTDACVQGVRVNWSAEE